ncbi:hypothetical protein DUNSADRAFT_2832 [Dunaliella salina]|uniref:Encoded protein n=1 Tax=Dunaliella salina TaxID=3046 RepID=A0ABQ7FVW3_DUNSA|nr:hypothetical protein DUNSADRAFT_2832 [Dunaliella salina]|eukprot:KAF5826520.1 hypothetical protein DUNSADRAFT_2832 [Dunaliella salina]
MFYKEIQPVEGKALWLSRVRSSFARTSLGNWSSAQNAPRDTAFHSVRFARYFHWSLSCLSEDELASKSQHRLPREGRSETTENDGASPKSYICGGNSPCTKKNASKASVASNARKIDKASPILTQDCRHDWKHK